MVEVVKLFDLAIDMERAGARLYRGLAEKHALDIELRDVFTFLAIEEDSHEQELLKIRAGLAEAAIQGNEILTPSKMQAFLSVFSPTRLSDERQRITNLPSALDFAIRREMDSVFLYHEVEAIVSGHDGSHVRKLIADEREHFSRLTGLRAAAGN